jgi:serine/threonine protein kinase
MTTWFNFERDLLDTCRSHKMSRVVQLLTSGTVETVPGDSHGVVQYIMFELADGDVRSYIDHSGDFDLAWALRAIHHAAVGLTQLHNQGIAHQDLKPSNLLVFAGDKSSKVADLGCASIQDKGSPREPLIIAGDPSYAPPELHYRHLHPDWTARRVGCDMYLLGSMITFIFCRTSMAAMLADRVDEEHSPGRWGGTYAQVLPVLQRAFALALGDIKASIPESVRADVGTMVAELCDPDPLRRGARAGAPAGQFSLRTYVTRLDLIASKAELRLPPRGAR